ncbi:ketol-acid reductoisomerase [Candidatus Cetobacterium colombiensis]|uniref:Ketol-acid reductoisomerase (NADP(+)) n=1 Tax=Candidatus Cetobacterium colombiensis TaxID=3073100 RepID=A0ABU4WEL9_9FUSO|nr:ketol-acid reductoisomerase [Candidatus Cetobacterium colombiensis]MDX8336850.1 ketol-acid reductoisomerase [Candidatus Cetobacterium colombiensis]
MSLLNKKVVVFGYGSQGHAHALNLKDSGYNVSVALREDSRSCEKARKDGFEVLNLEKAAKVADVAMLLVPDENQPELYREYLKDGLKKGAFLGFAHGFNIHYSQIDPREDLNVFMVAPKSPGHKVRDKFLEKEGVPALISVYQDPSKETLQLAKDWAKGVCLNLGVLETTFKEETETDLFGEQAVLCGGLVELMKAGYETLLNAGYDEKLAYFECVHEMKLIVDLIYSKGFAAMRESISNTAEYGDYVTGKKIITKESRENMREVLEDIQNGKFAKDFILEGQAGYPILKTMRKRCRDEKIEIVGNELREMMFKK